MKRDVSIGDRRCIHCDLCTYTEIIRRSSSVTNALVTAKAVARRLAPKETIISPKFNNLINQV